MVSKPYNMSLISAAEKVAAEFEYPSKDLNDGVQEFMREMGKPSSVKMMGQESADIRGFAEEGLQKTGTSMSQIPSYVTAVPNGTEKVRIAV